MSDTNSDLALVTRVLPEWCPSSAWRAACIRCRHTLTPEVQSLRVVRPCVRRLRALRCQAGSLGVGLPLFNEGGVVEIEHEEVGKENEPCRGGTHSSHKQNPASIEGTEEKEHCLQQVQQRH